MERSQKQFSKLGEGELVKILVESGFDIPDGLVEEILARGEKAVEPLGEIIIDEGLWEASGKEGWGVIHAMHLLGGIKSLKALPYFEKCLVPNRNADMITEGLPAILGAFGPGALQSLKRMAENRQADKYNRNAAVRAMCLIAYRHGECKGEVVRFLRELFRNASEEQGGFVDLIVDDLAYMRDPEAREDIRRAFENDLICEISWKEIEQIYAQEDKPPTIEHDDEDPLEYFSRDNLNYLKRINTKHADLPEKWNQEESKMQIGSAQKTIKKKQKIGRNEPCPCGSGKKYKKCCGR